MNIDQKLVKLREGMKAASIDGYIVPSSDPHQSEYVADHWASRAWISGFTGSAGTAIVTHNHAGVWTDVRYFLQAETELSSSSFELHKMNQFAPSYIQWVADNLPENSTVGIDGYNFSISQANSMRKILAKKNIKLDVNKDFIADIWTDRPKLPTSPIFIHDKAFQGDSMGSRIEKIQATLADKEHLLVTTLDDIAWLLHLRGHDVNCNPVAIAYVIVHKHAVDLYIDISKIDDKTKAEYQSNHVNIKPYHQIKSDLSEIPINETIILDPSICSEALNALIFAKIKHEKSIIRSYKAIKNTKEVDHIREAMIKDGVALTKAFKWLEEHVSSNDINEYALLEVLAKYRSEQSHYYGESFGAIVGYKGNGAIIHYAPPETGSSTIKPSGVLLCDSGGQYYDGTTDITRTFAMGDDVSQDAKLAYTLVLKGMIALDNAVFPEGTSGGQLDTLARQFLWEHGLNYGHGTGHGVGYFLNVHEPPQGFAPGLSSARAATVHKAGMITSNEPGFYKAGEYGIRIENVIVTKKHQKEGYLCHESLTVYPIDTKMMLIDKLTTQEIKWINDYHEKCYDLISPRLSEEESVWLKSKCVAI